MQMVSIQNLLFCGVSSMSRVKDLTGLVIGCNKVLSRVVPPPRGTNAWWRVQCIHCGREKIEMGSRLNLKEYSSCSCQTKITKGNSYDIVDNIAKVHTSSGIDFIIDLTDLEVVQNYTWNVCKTTNGKLYVRNSLMNVTLHRYLLGANPNKVVDHINGDTLNNCRSNLRECTHIQNMQNQRLRSNSSTGVKGVTLCGRKYRATICVNKKDIHLGIYETLEEAKEVRLNAEREYFKEFSFVGGSQNVKTSI